MHFSNINKLCDLINESDATFIYGNLLQTKLKYMAHQCNCQTNYAKGLAE